MSNLPLGRERSAGRPPVSAADPLVLALRLVLMMIAERRAAERVEARAKLRVVDGGGQR